MVIVISGKCIDNKYMWYSIIFVTMPIYILAVCDHWYVNLMMYGVLFVTMVYLLPYDNLCILVKVGIGWLDWVMKLHGV